MQKFCFMLLCAIAFSPVFAQTNSPGLIQFEKYKESSGLTLPMALEKSLQFNPDLAVASREIDALGGNLRQAGLIPNPELETLLEDTRKDTRNTTVQLNQRLEFSGKRSARIVAAQRDIDIAEAELFAKRNEVRAAVITGFYSVLISQDRYRLAREFVDLAKRSTHVATKRVSAGKVSPIEETKARIAEASVVIELTQAENELKNSRKQLAATWGETSPKFDHVEGQVDVLPNIPAFESLLERLNQSPAVNRLETEIKKRQAIVQVERSKQAPDVTVSLGVKKNNELGFNQKIIGLTIPLPLFDRNQGNLQEALKREDKAKDEFSSAKVRIENELSQVHQRLSLSYQEADLLQKQILPGAKQAYDAAAKGYALGKFNFLEVLDAQRTLFQAQVQYLKALSDAHKATAELERIVGVPVQSTLQQ